MKYPLYTYNDGTEVTVSSVQNGKVRICTERFDANKDIFFTAIISIPDGTVISSCGFSEKEVGKMVEMYRKLSSDIMDYVIEKENPIREEQPAENNPESTDNTIYNDIMSSLRELQAHAHGEKTGVAIHKMRKI